MSYFHILVDDSIAEANLDRLHRTNPFSSLFCTTTSFESGTVGKGIVTHIVGIAAYSCGRALLAAFYNVLVSANQS